MIEGLRAAPWVYEARTRGVVKDCEDCMQKTTPHIRLEMGCGFLPADRKSRIQPRPEALADGHAEEWETCPVYTTALPDVVDASHAATWSDKGELELYCDGRPAPSLLAAVGLIRGAWRGFEAHKMKHPDKSGGR